MGLGSYPAVPLAEACKKAREAREQIEKGIDPIEVRKTAKSGLQTISFAEASRRYIASKEPEWKSKKHAQQWRNTLATYAEEINHLPVSVIGVPEICDLLSKIWTTKNQTATRVRERIERVLDWATVMKFRSGENPARWKANLDNLLAAPKKVQKAKHFESLPWDKTPQFIDQLQARPELSARALEFTILTACRTQEVLHARWEEFDLSNRRWVIPADRMKAGREHHVPLSDEALRVLSYLPTREGLLFSSKGIKPLSNMTMLNLLKSMTNKSTVHGFRSTFRTWAAEQTNHPREVCEAVLAHKVGDDTELRYKRTDFFARREALMQEWADFLYGMKADERG